MHSQFGYDYKTRSNGSKLVIMLTGSIDYDAKNTPIIEYDKRTGHAEWLNFENTLGITDIYKAGELFNEAVRYAQRMCRIYKDI